MLRDNITSQDWSTNQRQGSPPGQPIRGEEALLGWNVVLQSLQHCTRHSQVCRWHLQLETLLFLLMPVVHCHQTALCAMSHSDTPLPTLHCPLKATRNCYARNINSRYHNDRLFKESRDKVFWYLRISVLMGATTTNAADLGATKRPLHSTFLTLRDSLSCSQVWSWPCSNA